MRLRFLMGAAGLCLAAAHVCMADELENPPDMQMNGQGQYVLTARTAEYRLPPYGDHILTRSFVSEGRKKGGKDRARLVGPTLRAHPGEVVKLHFANEMKQMAQAGDDFPVSPAINGHSALDTTYVDTLPHGFDILNLHTHGLHVSPQGNSDNVLLNILPADAKTQDILDCQHSTDRDVDYRHVCVQGAFDYEYKIPEKHPAGTYWYHPHKHGSVAIQLGSGMAGALIIEDDKTGIDSLPAVKQAKSLNGERILVVQEILYTRTNAADEMQAQYAVNCQAVYGSSICSTLGNKSTTTSAVNQKFSVNGQMDPTITMAPGEAMLWRVINTTVGNVLPFCLVPMAGTKAPAPALYALAADGIPIQRPLPPGAADQPFPLGAPVYDLTTKTAGTDVITNELVLMAPGQRLDLMVKAPDGEGRYALIQAPAPSQSATTSGLCQGPLTVDAEGRIPASQLVMFVEVKKHGRKVNSAVPTQSELNRLYTPIDLTKAKDVPPGPTQGVVFGFTNVEYAPSAIGGASVVNGRPFNLERVQRRLKLGQMDRWGVQSASDTHMFHIHINSFQVVKRGSVDYDFPIWRDTALINCAPGPGGCTFPNGNTLQPGSNPPGGNGEILQFLSRALDFTGGMVMHCHNVNHEDNGMMELVELAK